MPSHDTVAGRIVFLVSFFCLMVRCGPSYQPADGLAARLPEVVDFNFHVKPILADRCFPCHGPDQGALKGDLPLHIAEAALQQPLSSGQYAFVPHQLNRSEAFQRILSTNPERQMPPPEFQRKLSAYEIALIARWIEQGAVYKKHWSFLTPTKPKVPVVEDTSWCRDSIDYFVLAKLNEKGMAPKEAADKETLLRRVTLDLIGLPPSIKEIDDFLHDHSPDAYTKVVDRLLASVHFGERLALVWLDLARYADSNGYSQDGLRIMWPWRDWVIKAFNDNMPYDQFITWQIAGDKLVNPNLEQKLATGFLRNHRLNGEGGIIDEEYRVEYVADRTETTATAFLGLTFQCARCHDHKYDPITQEEYFQFFSFFNSVNETGITANDGNSGPELVLSSDEVEQRIRFIDQQIEKAQKEAGHLAQHLKPAQNQEPALDLSHSLLVDLSFEEFQDHGFINQVNGSEFFMTRGTVEQTEGAIGRAIKFTAYDLVSLKKDQLHFGRGDAFSFSFYLKCLDQNSDVTVLNHLSNKANNYPGYEIAVKGGIPIFRLVHSLPAVVLDVRGDQKLKSGKWEHLVFTYDGSGGADGVEIYLNGKKGKQVVLDRLSQGITSRKKELTIGGMIAYQTDRKGACEMDELKIYDRTLSAIEAKALYVGADLEPAEFSVEDHQEHLLTNYHPEYQKSIRQIRKLRKEKFQIQDSLTSVMVMEDLPYPRPTFVLDRGSYDAPSKRVFSGTPSALGSAVTDSLANRAKLARWLLDPGHPLTARVAVNRFWHLLFGRGIVKTLEDFGNQGDLPSHPKLLDWLARTFVESDWDIKSLLRQMVLSATYRQSSRAPSSERLADPANIYLSRGPSSRLSAELIRDVALAASGLLVRDIGGPSVKPYQPPGLWSEKGEFSMLKNYHQDHGPNLYRRSLYTFWRRTSPPPSLATFDAPTRDICIVSRQATNTPLQALVLQNDPQFVESARVLAEKVIRSDLDNREAVALAYRLLTGKHPAPEIVVLLSNLKENQHQKYLRFPKLAHALMEVGEFPLDLTLDLAEVAATTIVVSTIMSFDETLTKR